MLSSSKTPKIDAKHFHYLSDGNGRDNYISRNNGGLLSQKMLKQLEISPKPTYTPMLFPVTSKEFIRGKRPKNLPPPIHQRIVHYYGDGKGRDLYMTLDNGGQCKIESWRDHVDNVFPRQLRDYSEKWGKLTAFDYQKNNQKLQRISRERAIRQTQLSRQLSTPKIQLQRSEPSFKPDLEFGGKYQSYQTPEYQTKSRVNYQSLLIK